MKIIIKENNNDKNFNGKYFKVPSCKKLTKEIGEKLNKLYGFNIEFEKIKKYSFVYISKNPFNKIRVLQSDSGLSVHYEEITIKEFLKNDKR